MDSIMVRMETIINMINEENEGLVSQQNKENEKFLFCRICFDGMKFDWLLLNKFNKKQTRLKKLG